MRARGCCARAQWACRLRSKLCKHNAAFNVYSSQGKSSLSHIASCWHSQTSCAKLTSRATNQLRHSPPLKAAQQRNHLQHPFSFGQVQRDIFLC
jgi:hypothetical protein